MEVIWYSVRFHSMSDLFHLAWCPPSPSMLLQMAKCHSFFMTEVCLVKAMVFPVVMYGCESWTIKKAECQRRFWAVVLEKTLESSLDCKEIQPVHPKENQSWIFIGRTDAEAETPIFGHLMWRTDSFERLWCWERLKAGGEGNDRGWDGWMASLTQWTWVWVSSGSCWWTGRPCVLQSMRSKETDMTEQLNWTAQKA